MPLNHYYNSPSPRICSTHSEAFELIFFTSLLSTSASSAASAMPKCHASTLTEQFADLNKTYTNLNQPSFLHQINSRSVRLKTGAAFRCYSLWHKSSFLNMMNILEIA